MFVPIIRRNAQKMTDADGVQEGVEIADGPIKQAGRNAGSVAGGISATAVASLISLLTFFLVDRPKASSTREMEIDRAQLTALERAMTVGTADGRRVSVRLLAATGVLDPEHPDELQTLLAGDDTLPLWIPQPRAAQAGSASGTAGRPATDTTARAATDTTARAAQP